MNELLTSQHFNSLLKSSAYIMRTIYELEKDEEIEIDK
jgi:hypothetical protein